MIILLAVNYIISMIYITAYYETLNFKEVMLCVIPYAMLIFFIIVIIYFCFKHLLYKGKITSDF